MSAYFSWWICETTEKVAPVSHIEPIVSPQEAKGRKRQLRRQMENQKRQQHCPRAKKRKNGGQSEIQQGQNRKDKNNWVLSYNFPTQVMTATTSLRSEVPLRSVVMSAFWEKHVTIIIVHFHPDTFHLALWPFYVCSLELNFHGSSLWCTEPSVLTSPFGIHWENNWHLGCAQNKVMFVHLREECIFVDPQPMKPVCQWRSLLWCNLCGAYREIEVSISRSLSLFATLKWAQPSR